MHGWMFVIQSRQNSVRSGGGGGAEGGADGFRRGSFVGVMWDC